MPCSLGAGCSETQSGGAVLLGPRSVPLSFLSPALCVLCACSEWERANPVLLSVCPHSSAPASSLLVSHGHRPSPGPSFSGFVLELGSLLGSLEELGLRELFRISHQQCSVHTSCALSHKMSRSAQIPLNPDSGLQLRILRQGRNWHVVLPSRARGSVWGRGLGFVRSLRLQKPEICNTWGSSHRSQRNHTKKSKNG